MCDLRQDPVCVGRNGIRGSSVCIYPSASARCLSEAQRGRDDAGRGGRAKPWSTARALSRLGPQGRSLMQRRQRLA